MSPEPDAVMAAGATAVATRAVERCPVCGTPTAADALMCECGYLHHERVVELAPADAESLLASNQAAIVRQHAAATRSRRRGLAALVLSVIPLYLATLSTLYAVTSALWILAAGAWTAHGHLGARRARKLIAANGITLPVARVRRGAAPRLGPGAGRPDPSP